MKKIVFTIITLTVCLMSASSQTMIIQLKDGQKVTYKTSNIEIVEFEEANYNGHEYVDLGLSVKWATKNIGASEINDYGNYYAWGETSTKSVYSGSAYKWYDGVRYSDGYTTSWYAKKYNSNPDDGIVDYKMSLDIEDDAAHVVWGGEWRMPTGKEIEELIDKCSFEWTSMNGVKGAKYTGPNGNSIFLPAAGVKSNSSKYYVGSEGFYWSSTTQDFITEINSAGAFHLDFGSSINYKSNITRHYGLVIRPVCP